MDFKIDTDTAAVQAMVQADIDECLGIVSLQILLDCNYFCKQDQSGLIASSLSQSDTENGDLIWQTAYAVAQYYLDSASHDINPNASKMWCEKAYARFGQDWEALLQKLLDYPELRSQIKAGLAGSLAALK